MSDRQRPKEHHFNGEESSSSSDSDVECEERNDSCRSDELPPPDFYCRICKSSMNSTETWGIHVNGKKHIKKMTEKAYSLGKQVKVPPGTITQTVMVSNTAFADIPTRPVTEQAYIQDDFESINDQAVLGLDFVSEIWRMDGSLGLAYLCTLCQAECQPVTITTHVTGFRHRMRYLKHVDVSTHRRFKMSNKPKSIVSDDLSRYAKRLEKQYGKGTVQVLHEVSAKSEESSEENEDERRVRSPIVDNRSSMESMTPLFREQGDPGLATKAPEVPPKPKVIKLTKVQREHIAKSFITIEDPVRRAALIKTFGVEDILTNEDVVQENARDSAIDSYIKKKIENIPDDTRRFIIHECKFHNMTPLREYFKLQELAAAKDNLPAFVEAELRKEEVPDP